VSGLAANSYEEAFRTGLFHAEEGLDLLSILGDANLSIANFDDEHLAWWPGTSGLIIRLFSVAPLKITVAPATITQKDTSGRVVPPTPQSPLSWHESFRYFRLSQTTDDLFDAYRNAYLALEAILSDIAPPKPREGEGAWVQRALTEAGKLIALARHAPPSTVDPIAYLKKVLYSDTRSPISHAKSGRVTLLPRDEAARQSVAESLKRLAGLYLDLAKIYLGVRRSGSAMFAGGFRVMASRSLSALEVFASDDESPRNPAATSVNPAGGRLLPISPTVESLDSATPFLTTRLFSAPAKNLRSLPYIRRVAGTHEGMPVMASVLEGRLQLGSASMFEVVMGYRGENQNQPRSRYAY
jgi:hypothetical protein